MANIYDDFEKHYQKIMADRPADLKMDMYILSFYKEAMFEMYKEAKGE